MSIKQFYLKYNYKLMGYACAFCHDYDLVQDVVNDSFIKSITRSKSFQDRESELISWFYMVIENRLIDYAVGLKDTTIRSRLKKQKSCSKKSTTKIRRSSS